LLSFWQENPLTTSMLIKPNNFWNRRLDKCLNHFWCRCKETSKTLPLDSIIEDKMISLFVYNHQRIKFNSFGMIFFKVRWNRVNDMNFIYYNAFNALWKAYCFNKEKTYAESAENTKISERLSSIPKRPRINTISLQSNTVFLLL
jgi:hypothetical protein